MRSFLRVFFVCVWSANMLGTASAQVPSGMLIRVSEVDSQVRRSWGMRLDNGQCRVYRAVETESQRWFKVPFGRCERARQLWNQLKQKPTKPIPPHHPGLAVVMAGEESGRVWLSEADRSPRVVEFLRLVQ